MGSLFDRDRSAERLPVSLITGFLGSGKTTLLNRLLQRAEMADSAVIINEFGEVPIDHLLVEPMPARPSCCRVGASAVPCAVTCRMRSGGCSCSVIAAKFPCSPVC
jgi:G3E family GTPase